MPTYQESIQHAAAHYDRITNPVISADNIEPKYRRARELVESHLGPIVKNDALSGGAVSYLYRVTGEYATGIVKVRGTHFSLHPDQVPGDKYIDYEWRALQFLSAIEPGTFPHPIAYDREAKMILMTDVMDDGRNLYDKLMAGETPQEELFSLGATIARVHKKLTPVEASFVDGNDKEEFIWILQSRFGVQDHPVLNNVMHQLTNETDQQLLPDITPKNIGRGQDGQTTICDLEIFHRGSLTFVYGYVAGFLLSHTAGDPKLAQLSTESFLQGIASEDRTRDLDDILLKKVTLGSALVTLRDIFKDYKIPFTPEEIESKVAAAHELLVRQRLTWPEITQKIALA